MEQKRYEPPAIVDLGSVQDLTLANDVGRIQDQFTQPVGFPVHTSL